MEPEKKTPKHPLHPRDLLLYKGIKRVPNTFTEEQINIMITQTLKSDKYLNNDWGRWMRWRDVCMIATAYLCGMRNKEVCCLRFDDFDMNKKTIHIRGENNHTHKDRVIPTPQKLMKFYKEYFRFPQERFWKGSKFIFPSFQNNHISPKRFEMTFREKVLKPLGYWKAPIGNGRKSKTNPYTLRHSRASHMLKKQIKEFGIPDLYAIANFLGHSDIRVTTAYLHTNEDYMDYLREQINL